MGQMDHVEITRLYRLHHPGLVRYLRGRPNVTPALADDIAAVAWERVITSTYDPSLGTFPAWLHAIARNAIAEHWRITNRRPETLDGDMTSHNVSDGALEPGDAVILQLRREWLQGATQALESPLQKAVVVLRFYDGLSVAETARIMGKSPNAVKQLQVRAFRNLTLHLDRNGSFTND